MIAQPILCGDCMAHAHELASSLARAGWISCYYTHHRTLALAYCDRGAIQRMQLNGPLSANQARAHVEAVIADSLRASAAHGGRA